jgi:hypothetical protein
MGKNNQEQTLAHKLQQLGAEVLKLHLKYPNDQRFGKEVRSSLKEHLDKVLKKHYIDKNKGVKTS